MDPILLVLLVALAVTFARFVQKRWERAGQERERARTPGLTPDRPARVDSAEELDEVLEALRCACGGELDRWTESTRASLKVVRCRCRECEDDVDVFFDVAVLLN